MIRPEDFSQSGFRLRSGWGSQGLRALAPHVDRVVIVDVLSFATACAVAREAGATVIPHDPDVPPPDGVLVAGPRSLWRPSLSPASLRNLKADSRIVIPSPNGSRLLALSRSLGLEATTGCLRDRHEVAAWIGHERTVALVAAGERWPNGSLRFALEDWMGVGAVAALLPGSASPEVVAARAAYEALAPDVEGALRRTASGQELLHRGYALDVTMAAALRGGP